MSVTTGSLCTLDCNPAGLGYTLGIGMGNDPTSIRAKEAFILDMDGVVYRGTRPLPGALEFVRWLQGMNKKFLFLTNSSEHTPRELSQKLARLGISVSEEHFYTSAQATAAFLASQKPGGSAFVIGEPGLVHALYQAGYTINDVNPDYVVVGETRSYNYDQLKRAVRLVLSGARLIGTNPDVTGPVEDGIVPATRALVAPIELATGVKAYFVGKPNPLMIRQAMQKLDARRQSTVIIGDRIDTDIRAGVEAGIETVLLLSGVSTESDLHKYAYRPGHVYPDLRALLP